ncbi:MAG: DUF6249 domain-containing protein [Thermoanaerobaculia bacterium]
MDVFLVPIVAIIFGCLIAIFGIIFSYLEKKRQYESIEKMVEAGKNPEEIKEFFLMKNKRASDPHLYLKRGVITLAIGLGTIGFGVVVKVEALYGIGIFILILGIAFLLLNYLIKNKN